jgi:hypothetical protein
MIMANETRQHYALATGKSVNNQKTGKPSSPKPYKKGGKAKKGKC